ncbi:MAG: hypothetical protein ACOC92_01705 [bacterium]
MHIPYSLIVAVERGEVPAEDLEELEREHLSAACKTCARGILEGEARTRRPGSSRYVEPDDPLERLRQRLDLREMELHKHVERARSWVRQVVKMDPSKRREKVGRANSRLQGPVFCILLLEEARRHIPGDPAEALSLADAAVGANVRYARDFPPDPEIQAPALAVRGNAKRALGRIRAAEEDLEAARKLLDSPALTDPLTGAEVHAYLGSLRKDQGYLEEALFHLRRAAVLYQVHGHREEAARELLTMGTVYYRHHEFSTAVESDRRALDLLDEGSQAWLLGYAHYNLAFHLHAAGETDRAAAYLKAHTELILSASDQLANLFVWLRARIAWSREDLQGARKLFTEARKRALDRGIAWDAGLVGLELALVELVEGRTGRARKLATEALELFAEQDVARETRAALELLEAAARQDALTREALERAVAALEEIGDPHRPADRPSS